MSAGEIIGLVVAMAVLFAICKALYGWAGNDAIDAQVRKEAAKMFERWRSQYERTGQVPPAARPHIQQPTNQHRQGASPQGQQSGTSLDDEPLIPNTPETKYEPGDNPWQS